MLVLKSSCFLQYSQMKFRILQMDKLQHIIEQKQELLICKSVSLLTLDYSDDMTAEEQKRYINHLMNCVKDADLESCAMKLVLQDFLDKQKADAKRLTKLDDILSRVESLKSSLEKKKALFEEDSNQNRDENDFDGISSSLPKKLHSQQKVSR